MMERKLDNEEGEETFISWDLFVRSAWIQSKPLATEIPKREPCLIETER